MNDSTRSPRTTEEALDALPANGATAKLLRGLRVDLRASLALDGIPPQAISTLTSVLLVSEAANELGDRTYNASEAKAFGKLAAELAMAAMVKGTGHSSPITVGMAAYKASSRIHPHVSTPVEKVVDARDLYKALHGAGAVALHDNDRAEVVSIIEARISDVNKAPHAFGPLAECVHTALAEARKCGWSDTARKLVVDTIDTTIEGAEVIVAKGTHP